MDAPDLMFETKFVRFKRDLINPFLVFFKDLVVTINGTPKKILIKNEKCYL